MSFLLQSEASRQTPPPPIRPVSRHSTLVVSYAQQRLWYLDQLEPNTAVYNIPVAFKLKGNLDPSALEQSANEVIRRHEALRTTIGLINDLPVQIIAPHVKIELPVIDLRDHQQARVENELTKRLRTESQHTFTLAEGPLVRMNLIQTDKDEHVFFFNTHHVVFDGWSIDIFLNELTALYKAFTGGQSPCLPALPIQYADYAVWQREWLESGELERQLGYWQKQLCGELPVLQMRTDRPRPPIQTYRGSMTPLQVSKALGEDLKELGRTEGCTLFMVLLAAFKALLYRYTGQEDIIVGSPIANRTRPELEGLIGFFANTLVLRTRFQGNLPFRDFLGRVRETCLEAYSNQDTPFERLVEELKPERDLSRTPLFQALFTFQDTTTRVSKMSGVSIAPINLDSAVARTDMSFWVTETADGLTGELEYSTDLFDRETITRFLEHFRVLLESIVDNPETSIDKLPLLTEAERHTLLVEWNATEADYPREASIQALFEDQVERTPDSVAYISEKATLTYRELNQRANQLAHHLRSCGVGPDVLTGICMDRSTEMIIGLLGILKAGGAYVPLDPDYPAERLAYMISDSAMPVLVTQSALLDRLPELTAQTICLDTGWDEISRQSTENPPLLNNPDNLAYVIYTSGSTGKPKGVQVPHGAVVNFLAGMAREPGLTGDDVLLAVTTLSFDIAVLELFLPLVVGAKTVLASREAALDGVQLKEALANDGITVMQATPATWRVLLAAGWEGSDRLTVLCGGEAFPRDLAPELIKRASRVWNMYGPTETTIWSTCYQVTDPDGPVLIGHPIDNTQTYILDNAMQPVPIGVPGELYIGGSGVTTGYLNRPDLTSRHFVTDPFSTDPQALLYKTGDLTRYLPDGNIEYLSRLDNQVKVRGFRIELGEIEAVLADDPAVEQAAVTVREDRPGDTRLVAYLLSRPGHELNAHELRVHLRKQLPEYMIPQHFVTLDQLPLTPNGKIDRKALPPLDTADTLKADVYVPPATETEKVIAAIWQEIIGVERVSADANFFDTGGHSLLATQITSRLSRHFNIDLKLRTFFESPTIAQLSRVIKTLRGETQGSSQSHPISQRSEQTPPPLSHAQQRLWYLDQLEPNTAVFTIPMALRLKGCLDPALLERCLNDIIRRHEPLRTSIIMEDHTPRQIILPDVYLELPLVDLTDHSPEKREEKLSGLLRAESQRSFNFPEAPLLCMSLIRMDRDDHVLFFMAHHVVFDGWSSDILVREMIALYTAFGAGEPSPLPDLPIQYADFSVWQREWLESGELERQLDFWREQFPDEIPVLQMPTDRPRPAIQTYRGSSESLTVSGELIDELTRLSRTQGCTLFMVFLAAFKTLLYRYTGQEDIIVGTPIANRTRPELEELIGFFANTLVLRTRFQADLPFRQLLGRVRETCLGAYNNQDTPFEVLVEELNPERDLSRTPLFQALFAFQNVNNPLTGMAGITLSPMDIDIAVARTDMTFWVTETADGLTGVLEYSTDLFDRETITRFLEHFRVLLESIVDNPETSIDKLPLLTEAERHTLLVEWNATEADYPREASIQALFEDQVERTPDSVAYISEKATLTYRELNQRANQLAHHLRSCGVGPDVLTGICMDRSTEMIIGLLGILKAGGAYVPLDPDYPAERLAYMISDSAMPVLVTQSALLDRLPELTAQTICLDTGWDEISRQSTENPPLLNNPDNLAYVIYTSGSTGKPKGVQVPHGAVVNFLAGMAREPGLTGDDVLLAVTTLSFDIAVLELFLPLVVGAKTVLASREAALDGVQLKEALTNDGITVMQATPATWRVLLAAGWEGSDRLTVLCGGEAFPRDLAPELIKRASRVWNMYGPTETTIWSTCYQVTDPDGPVLIGHPIDNTQTYILDNAMQPVPIGVPGELYIGGSGVTRGYLNRPDLTSRHFVTDPFSTDPQALLYKTGDLARYLPDGNIEYLGRLDNQVKVRGFRIELGEIEAVLADDPAVEQAAVTVREDRPGDTRLVAYLVPCTGHDLQVHELRAHLRKQLPEYMIPQHFVTLDQLPLTPNGKIDRKALPPLDTADILKADSYCAPRNSLELQLVNIWSEVLGNTTIGIRDNFFDIGGHSLIAVRLFSKIQRLTAKNLPLATLYQAPTIEQMAEILLLDNWQPLWSSLVPIQPAGSKPPFFCIHGAGGNVLLYRDLARFLGDDQPFYGIQSRGLDGKPPFHTRIEDMAADYIEEIKKLQPEGPYYLGGYCMGGQIAYEVAQQLQKQGQKIALVALFDTQRLWSPETFSLYCYQSLQRILFHCASIFQAKPGNRLVFIAHKAKEAVRRIKLSIDIISSNITYKTGIRKEPPLIRMEKLNDQASIQYTAKPFSGKVTVFSPLRAYAGYEDPMLGWGDGRVSELEIHQLHGYPATMLVEPFVAELADKLQECLKKARATPTDSVSTKQTNPDK